MGKTATKNFFLFFPKLGTLLLAGVTIVASFSGSVEPKDSMDMQLLGLAVPVLLILNLVVCLCWAFAHKRWALVSLLALVFNWSYIAATFQVNMPKTRNKEALQLKIATYNVQFFGSEIMGYSCKQLAQRFEEEGVDILCFQEFDGNQHFPLDSLKQVLAHWPYYAISSEISEDSGLPIAVFSRYPIGRTQYFSFDKSANGSLLCDIATERDTVRVINSHLQTTSISQNRHRWERRMNRATDTRGEVEVMESAGEDLQENFIKRAEQTRIIEQYANYSPYPVLVCGDFNSIPSSFTYHHLNKTLKDGFRTAGSGYMYTYRYAKRLLRIDYIFHSENVRGIEYKTHNWDLCSDHNPVVMEVEL